MSHNEILVVMFEISGSALMKANDDGHYFTERELRYNQRLCGIADKPFMPFWFKNQTEIINITEYTGHRHGSLWLAIYGSMPLT